jgi:hypothetical protein
VKQAIDTFSAKAKTLAMTGSRSNASFVDRKPRIAGTGKIVA